jgi:sodium-independent sulfate anion transporter 11
MSTGPTSLMGLLTAEIIRDVQKEGYKPQAIASAVALSVGIYALVIGMLKLGFLLEFISIPVLSGFISAAAIVIMLGQIPSLFGVSVGTGTANIIHDLFQQIPDFDGPTTGIGLGGIVILVLMQKVGQRWGKKNKAIWLLALGRSAVVLILFTGISYAVNKDRVKNPIWALSKVQSNGIENPKMPSSPLISKVFPRSIAPFIAAAIEHLAIAKAFGRKNSYVIDPAQELVYLGITNFFNSFFSSMAVGGAMSRTAVNSDSGVKSPTYGLVAGGVVILSIYKLSPALFWIPKATLAAIIVTAVWHILVPLRIFYSYWKTSLVDFISAMLAFWLTLFVSSEVGIGAAVGFGIAYHLVFAAFHRVRRITSLSPHSSSLERPMPLDTQVFAIEQSMLFYNAYRIKGQCLDAIQTFNSGDVQTLETAAKERNWSVAGEKRATRLRTKAEIPCKFARSSSM